MANFSETGHAKNVATYEKLVTTVTGFGTVYNPSKESIQLPALNNLLVTAKTAIADLNAVEGVWKNAVKARELAFDPLSGYFGVIVPLVSVMLCHKKRMTSWPKLLIYLRFFHFVFP
jgi:hypothetical protein